MSYSNPPIHIREKTVVSVPLFILIAGIGPIFMSAVVWTSLRGDVSTNTDKVSNHEERIKKLEESQRDLAVIKNDVMWIRQSLETLRYQLPSQPPNQLPNPNGANK